MKSRGALTIQNVALSQLIYMCYSDCTAAGMVGLTADDGRRQCLVDMVLPPLCATEPIAPSVAGRMSGSGRSLKHRKRRKWARSGTSASGPSQTLCSSPSRDLRAGAFPLVAAYAPGDVARPLHLKPKGLTWNHQVRRNPTPAPVVSLARSHGWDAVYESWSHLSSRSLHYFAAEAGGAPPEKSRRREVQSAE